MNIQEHAAHMCHMITTNYPQQMASDLRLIEIHSRFANIVEDPVYYSGVHGERAFDAACNDFVDWEDALCYQS